MGYCQAAEGLKSGAATHITLHQKNLQLGCLPHREVQQFWPGLCSTQLLQPATATERAQGGTSSLQQQPRTQQKQS